MPLTGRITTLREDATRNWNYGYITEIRSGKEYPFEIPGEQVNKGDVVIFSVQPKSSPESYGRGGSMATNIRRL